MTAQAIDKVLISRVMNGDSQAHNKIYSILEGNLTSFIKRYLPQSEDASDIVQETMLEVWKSAHKFKGQSSFKSWIFAIARNKAIDCTRKSARFLTGEIPVETASEADDPCEVLRKKQQAITIRKSVEDLKPVQKAVIKLAFFKQISYSEIAEMEACPVGTVKTRIFSAKSQLKHSLDLG